MVWCDPTFTLVSFVRSFVRVGVDQQYRVSCETDGALGTVLIVLALVAQRLPLSTVQ
jgi:hypothetical protein